MPAFDRRAFLARLAAGVAAATGHLGAPGASDPPAGFAANQASTSNALAAPSVLRPPAVPLIAYDPYFSIWSPADRLTDAATVHWTGHTHPLTSLIRIDGDTARLMGSTPATTAALPQTSVTVRPTRTIYTFANAHVQVTLTFMTPSLPSDLDVLSRPVTYLSWDVASADGKTHQVQLY